MEAWDARIFGRRYWGGWHFPRHWTLYSPPSLRRCLSEAGFEVAETVPLLSPTFWAQSFHHKLSETRGLPWLAPVFDCKNFFAMALFSTVDMIQKSTAGTTSNMRMVARKPLRGAAASS